MLPLILAENFFNARLFPLHVLAADEEPVGMESWHVADGRRTPSDRWQGITANQQRTLTVSCDRIRAADTLVLDRGHNLAGKELALECSDDNFVSVQSVFDFVLPSVCQPGPISGPFGILTEEGAWAINFPDRAATYWRLRIPAMGAGLVPQIVGAWLGLSYSPGFLLTPWGDDSNTASFEEVVSEYLWRGRGPVAQANDGALGIKLLTEFDYELARYHLDGIFGSGKPTWICYDQAQAERMFLALRPQGRQGFELAQGWWPRQARINYVEHSPLRQF